MSVFISCYLVHKPISVTDTLQHLCMKAWKSKKKNLWFIWAACFCNLLTFPDYNITINKEPLLSCECSIVNIAVILQQNIVPTNYSINLSHFAVLLVSTIAEFIFTFRSFQFLNLEICNWRSMAEMKMKGCTLDMDWISSM